jgi:hypothetical protein
MDKIEIAEKSKWLKPIETNGKILFGIFCHQCSKYSLHERVDGKAPKKYDCKHCGSEEIELEPWWIINQEMSDNIRLQKEYGEKV